MCNRNARARDGTSTSREVLEAAKRELVAHSQVKNTGPPATLEEQDPDIIGDLSSLVVAPLQVIDIITRRSEIDNPSVSSADDPSPPAILTVSSSATKKGLDTRDEDLSKLQEITILVTLVDDVGNIV
ncbi:hypothetical protein OCU04_003776 [Sclerotinia nivalis]|uniref:Uncharacterized protein n=1 Tax=Sclerotinia nivalis TaxID=352851 RepID=A0A9X0DNK2_9HELO|nr:hypothetical protein OCU04_003776 [Sclerotinia nivalis]